MFRRRRRADEAATEAQASDATEAQASDVTEAQASEATGEQVSEATEARAAGTTGAEAASAGGVEGTARGGDEPATPTSGAPFDRSQGPWDASEVPDPGAAGRLDLGALWMPGVEGMELRVEMDQETERVVAVSVVLGESALQVQPFAAPRTGGLWDEVRADIAAGIAAQGGATLEQEGVFGSELLAQVPARTPEGKVALQVARFIGVDGPRWFLRGLVTGAAYHDPEAAAPLEGIFRGIVVVRGDAPMPRGELLAMRLPPQAVAPGPGDEEGTGEEPPAGPARPHPDLNPFARGPEITEIR